MMPYTLRVFIEVVRHSQNDAGMVTLIQFIRPTIALRMQRLQDRCEQALITP